MPSSLWSSAASELLEAQLATFGAALAVPGHADILCLTEPAEGTRELLEAGYTEGRSLRVELRQADAAARGLVIGSDQLTIAGQAWRILRSAQDPADPGAIIFFLVEP